ncbi:MAG: hypothetical protein Q7S81_02230 [bacterium]|nr:hypothetical protein [bacterium]
MNQHGYISLISSIIISILLLAVTFAISFNNSSSRFNILNVEFKERSLALAEACVDTALLKLAQNQSYGGNENISVGNDQCSILPIETSSGQKIIKTKAIFQNAVTNLKVAVQASNLSVVSWEEIAKF